MTDMAENLEHLIEHLRDAAERYRKDEAKNEGRDGARAAIVVILDYLRAAGVESKLVVPLEAVLGALEDAEKGAPNRLTMPEKTRRQPTKKNAADWAIAAAAVELLMQSGETAEVAAHQVKAWIPALNRTAQQLRTFRANLINDYYLPEVRGLYKHVLAEAAGLPPETAAKRAIELLREKLTK